jgi:hypothetical protein
MRNYYANTYGIPVNFTGKNTMEFRGMPYVFQKISYSVRSQKRTSVDTLDGMPLTVHPLAGNSLIIPDQGEFGK